MQASPAGQRMVDVLDRDEEIQLAFGRLSLCNINVEVAERVGFERLLHRLVIVNFGQPADFMSLKAAVQG